MKHIVDEIYDSLGESTSLAFQAKMAAHLFFCPSCAKEARKVEIAEASMTDFPQSPRFEDCIMAQIADMPLENAQEPEADISFRSWVITGIIILVSLSTSFFGMDFERIAHNQGPSFLIPVGITIGVVLTCYGTLFIGSHLKELSRRFGLR
jgi:hypothetical protein